MSEALGAASRACTGANRTPGRTSATADNASDGCNNGASPAHTEEGVPPGGAAADDSVQARAPQRVAKAEAEAISAAPEPQPEPQPDCTPTNRPSGDTAPFQERQGGNAGRQRRCRRGCCGALPKQRAGQSERDRNAPQPQPEPELVVADTEAEPEPEQPEVRARSGPPFSNLGISLVGLEDFLATHGAAIGEGTTTSDVCHAVIKPLTTPPGWACEAALIDAEKRWYRHRYVDAGSGAASDRAPPGTCSYLQRLRRAPETAAFVGAPTVFLSHAWTYKFRNVVAALRSYVEALPAGSPPPFFWFDCLSMDEHATQTLPQEWWSTTFQDAIRGIGCTLMVLSPWNDPVPLTRAWCLWELFSTDKVGADFRVCLGPDERRAFEAALVEDPDVIFEAFAHINVKNAQAGSAEDQAMILGAVERSVGFDGLNGLAFARMRAWVVGVARGLLQREGTGIGDRNQIGALFRQFGMHEEALEVHEGTLARPDAEADQEAFAATLNGMAGVYQEQDEDGQALKLYTRALDITVKVQGKEHVSVADTVGNMAIVYDKQGEYGRALKSYERALGIYEKAYGEQHVSVGKTLRGMAVVYQQQGEDGQALKLYTRALDITVKAQGKEHVSVADTVSHMAIVYDKQGEYGRALKSYERALGIYEKAYGEQHARVGDTCYNMAKAYRHVKGDVTQARELFLRSATCSEKAYGADHHKVIDARRQAARCRRRPRQPTASHRRLSHPAYVAGDEVRSGA
eukprot:COSAG01_NODE_103_length_26263_cov_31.957728_12_plen_744_part_00